MLLAVLATALTLIPIPIERSERVAIVAVFPVGEAHDPPGRSGLAHLCEHVLFTAAAGDFPSRTVDEMAARLGDGWNAHTSRDYTVIAHVVDRAHLAAEVRELAARLTDLRVEPALVDRERERIRVELEAMYVSNPAIATGNLARELLFEPEPGRRRGGTPEGLAAITADEVAARLRAHYGPSGAIVAIAGAVPADLDAPGYHPLRRLAAPGPAAPTLVALPEPAPRARPAAGEGAFAAAAFAAPRPSSPDYAPFLVAVSRLARASRAAKCTVSFAPFEDGRVLTISSQAGGFEALDALLARTDVTAPLTALDADLALAWVCGYADRQTEYEAAFRAAMLTFHGIDRDALAARLGKVTPADLARVAPTGRAWSLRAAIVRPRAPGASAPPRPLPREGE